MQTTPEFSSNLTFDQCQQFGHYQIYSQNAGLFSLTLNKFFINFFINGQKSLFHFFVVMLYYTFYKSNFVAM